MRATFSSAWCVDLIGKNKAVRVGIGALIEARHIGTHGAAENRSELPKPICQMPSHVGVNHRNVRNAKHCAG